MSDTQFQDPQSCDATTAVVRRPSNTGQPVFHLPLPREASGGRQPFEMHAPRNDGYELMEILGFQGT